MTLREKQSLFVRLVAEWVAWVYAQGYELTYGETKRTDEQAEINAMGPDGRARFVRYIEIPFPALAAKIKNNAGSGIRGSLHEIGLAADFNLFKDGSYEPTTEAWREIGEKWESMHELARWGGRFGDGNHLSLEHEGRK